MVELEQSSGKRLSEVEQWPTQIGIYDETDRLRTVVTWGPVGAEAVLAQLFPPEISLFHDNMDVLKARRETLAFASALESKGVTVIRARNSLAQLLPQKHLDRGRVQDALLAKLHEIAAKHRPAISQDGIRRHEDTIVELLEDDIKLHGKEQALGLNSVLCLASRLPLGNSLYARDQMNVLLGRRVQATMAKPIRKPEVSLYDLVYKKTLGIDTHIRIPRRSREDEETFEGGDAYVHNGIVYVGVGSRTTMQAAMHIYRELKPELEERGFKFAIVVDPDKDRPFRDQMDFMHLDTFSMPLGKDQILVCEEEAKRRGVFYLEARDGGIMAVNTQQSFLSHLQERGEKIVSIPRAEQKNFGANLLAIDAGTVIVPLDPLNANTFTIQALKNAGKQVEHVDLGECTKGYGAAHCMTGQLLRANQVA